MKCIEEIERKVEFKFILTDEMAEFIRYNNDGELLYDFVMYDWESEEDENLKKFGYWYMPSHQEDGKTPIYIEQATASRQELETEMIRRLRNFVLVIKQIEKVKEGISR